MAGRRTNPRLVKLNRTYDVAELARRLGVHRNTVRHWQRDGLTAIDGGRPVLFHGSTIRTFLAERNARRKSPCPPGTLYCFGCRSPREPALGMVDFVSICATSGNLRAICATCETVMHRRASRASLTAILPGCDVQLVEAQRRLNDSPRSSLGSDFERKVATP